MPINQRINKILNYYNLNYRSFGKKINASDVVIGNIIKGRNKPSYDILKSICQTFVNINSNWLLTGEGEMFKTDIEKNQSITGDCKKLEKIIETQGNMIKNQQKQIDQLLSMLSITNSKKIKKEQQ